MSKGLGASYITEQTQTWHQNDLLKRCYIPLMDGQKASMPRYFKDRLYTKADMELIGQQIPELEQSPDDYANWHAGEKRYKQNKPHNKI
jgi:hypothetical protein